MSKKEINEGAEKCVVAVDKTIAARDTQFTYDYVFPSNVEQIEGKFHVKCKGQEYTAGAHGRKL